MKGYVWPTTMKYLLVLASTIVITACGGGGSSDSPTNNSDTSNTAPTVNLNSKSDSEITSISGTAFSLGGKASEFGKDLNFSGKPLTGFCTNEATGGSADIPTDLSSGFGTLTFINCDLGSVILDGQLVLAASSIASFNTVFTLNAFSLAYDKTKLIFSGSMYVASSSSNLGIETARISSNGGTLSFKIESPTLNDAIEISQYENSYTDDTVNGVRSSAFSYIVSSTSLGGAVGIKTTQTIKQSYNLDPYPYEGAFEVTGSNNSKVRVTILGDGTVNGLVRVEIDKDGNGIYESSNDVLWTAFKL